MSLSQRIFLLTLLLFMSGAVSCMPPSWGAAALLHPNRHAPNRRPSRKFEETEIAGAGVKLKAWLFRAEAQKRGTVIYLHGSADNRASGIGIAEHFVPLGFDFLAYDSRAHGESGGDMCTYGFYEKRDLSRVIDRVESPPVVLLGSSLGAAVALQTAAEDARVAAVVGVATFSDLRTVAGERAPFFASKRNIEEAIRVAEDAGKFRFDEVSPVAVAPNIRAPVLLVHGEKDQETPPAHSQRVYDALHSPRRLILVPKAAHNDALTPEIWRQIDDWIFAALAKAKKAG